MFRAKRGRPSAANRRIRSRNARAARPDAADRLANPAAIRTNCSGVSAINSGRSEIRELAQARSPHHGLAHDRDHGHAHPEGVQDWWYAHCRGTCPARRRCGGRAPDTAREAGRRRRSRDRARRLPVPADPASVAVAALGGQDHQSRAIDGPAALAPTASEHAALTLQKLFRQPNVMWPFAKAGSALTAGSAGQRIVAPESVGQADRLLASRRSS